MIFFTIKWTFSKYFKTWFILFLFKVANTNCWGLWVQKNTSRYDQRSSSIINKLIQSGEVLHSYLFLISLNLFTYKDSFTCHLWKLLTFFFYFYLLLKITLFLPVSGLPFTLIMLLKLSYFPQGPPPCIFFVTLTMIKCSNTVNLPTF